MSMEFGDAMLRDVERRLEWQMEQAEQLKSRVEATTVTVESPGGEAAVTVDSSGGFADLRLTDRALRLGPDELAGVILSTSRMAQAQLAERVGELVNGLYGEGSQTATFISDVYAEQFPSPPQGQETDERDRQRR